MVRLEVSAAFVAKPAHTALSFTHVGTKVSTFVLVSTFAYLTPRPEPVHMLLGLERVACSEEGQVEVSIVVLRYVSSKKGAHQASYVRKK